MSLFVNARFIAFWFNRSCWRSNSWSNIKSCFWVWYLGPWWSVGWKVFDL